jgi:hypothetical protein
MFVDAEGRSAQLWIAAAAWITVGTVIAKQGLSLVTEEGGG